MTLSDDRIAFLKQDYVQGFPAYCGFAVEVVDYGRFETRLDVRPEHRQQDGFVHAGVIATMADHTGGYAAFTTVPADFRILTIEFKINFLKPADGDRIICRSQVLSGGRKIIVSESDVYSLKKGLEKRVSKAVITLTAVPGAALKP